MQALSPGLRVDRSARLALQPLRIFAVQAHRLRSHHGLAEARAVPGDAGMPAPMQAATRRRRPQLDIREQACKPGFYDAISKIMKIRERYLWDRCVFVEGKGVFSLLKHIGARDQDFKTLRHVSNGLVGDPTLPFRKTRNGRFCLDFDKQTARRLEFQPFLLSVGEDFKRHDSDTVRRFDEIQDDLQLNTALQALMIFKAVMLYDVATRPRKNLDHGLNKWVCTLFSLRTVTTPDLLDEPALEGIHADGVDHTITTFLNSQNTSDDSAVTMLHSMGEKTGIRFNEAQPLNIRGRVQHLNYLDTLMVVDNERKHSLSPVHAVDSSQSATRDMLVFFTRKRVTKGHVSADVDSLVLHSELPMEIPIFVPKQS
ncbi:hypothetical protein DL764_006999 [Monosporascus ibericus]|uniref:2OG-Fe dioxygenase-domain-containing protein n=1 Tax=Monosporascus ibericus TaxID=155417 RepID=A0A4Q4T3A5_9PEZI|nr:hypothetical protein DL764_006999 [Monosporascus ibericus]